MANKPAYTGSCHCGAISFEAKAPVLWCGHCHCTQCQKLHGAAFVTWVGFHERNVTLKDPQKRFTLYNSGKAERGFCKCCGSLFYYRYVCKDSEEDHRWLGYVHFTRASLDNPEQILPSEHIFWESRVKGIVVDDTLAKR